MSDLSPEAKHLLRAARAGLDPSAEAVAALRAAIAGAVLPAAAGSAGGAGGASGAGSAGAGSAVHAAGAGMAIAKVLGAALLLGAVGLGVTTLRARPVSPVAAQALAVSHPAPTEWAPAPDPRPERVPSLPSLPSLDWPSTPAESLRRPATAIPDRPRIRAIPREAALGPLADTTLDHVPAMPAVPALATQPGALAATTTATTAATTTTTTANVPAAPSASDAHSLVQEIALVRDAHAALDRGDAASALASLRDHARRYPNGTLREEALALQVLALCALDRPDAARAAARDLTRLAPSSAHLAGLRASCVGPRGGQ